MRSSHEFSAYHKLSVTRSTTHRPKWFRNYLTFFVSVQSNDLASFAINIFASQVTHSVERKTCKIQFELLIDIPISRFLLSLGSTASTQTDRGCGCFIFEIIFLAARPSILAWLLIRMKICKLDYLLFFLWMFDLLVRPHNMWHMFIRIWASRCKFAQIEHQIHHEMKIRSNSDHAGNCQIKANQLLDAVQ